MNLESLVAKLSDAGLRKLAVTVIYELRFRGDMDALAELDKGVKFMLELPQNVILPPIPAEAAANG